MGQESRSSLAGWFWLRVSCEVTVRLSTSTVVFLRLDGNRKVHFQDGTLTGYGQQATIPQHVGLTPGHLSVHRHLASLSMSNPGQKEKREPGYLL